MSAILKLDDACSAPWGKPLLKNISLTLESGEVVAIVGPNGAGKSSLLHLMAGGLPLSTGALTLADKPLGDWSLLQRAKSIALLSQQSLLTFPFTAEEVVALGRSPHNSGFHADQAIIDEVLLATDTDSLRHRSYTQLSGGEQQRVQLARALAQIWRGEDSAQRILMLDEPCNGLDLAHQVLLQHLIQRQADHGCAVVLVVHDFNFASAVADRVVVLDNGAIAGLGAPEAVLTESLFSQVFNVSPVLMTHPQSGRQLVLPP